MTLCTGSLGSNPNNDLPAIIRGLKGKIHFGHVRNLIHHAPGKFDEAAHLSSDGSFDMYEIMKAFYDIGFDGPIRPDHGRAIWGEVAMPGYGLYDRALEPPTSTGCGRPSKNPKNKKSPCRRTKRLLPSLYRRFLGKGLWTGPRIAERKHRYDETDRELEKPGCVGKKGI